MFYHNNLLSFHQKLDITISSWKEKDIHHSLCPGSILKACVDFTSSKLPVLVSYIATHTVSTSSSWSSTLFQMPMPRMSERWPPLLPVWRSSHWRRLILGGWWALPTLFSTITWACQPPFPNPLLTAHHFISDVRFRFALASIQVYSYFSCSLTDFCKEEKFWTYRKKPFFLTEEASKPPFLFWSLPPVFTLFYEVYFGICACIHQIQFWSLDLSFLL